LSVKGLSLKPCPAPLGALPEVRRSLETLDEDLSGAVKDLKDGSGLFPTAEDTLEILPRPAAECPFAEPFQVRRLGGRWAAEVPAEPLVLGWWDRRSLLAAALAWALLGQEVPAFGEAPLWFRAGASLHLSGFGTAYLSRRILESDAPLLLAGPLSEEEGAWAKGVLALSALEARKGTGALRRWINLLHAGRPFWEALDGAAGESPEAFEEGYRTFGAERLKTLTASRGEFREAVALLRQGKDQAALERLQAFVEERPLDLYAGDAAYYLNYARVRRGAYREAARGFTDLLVNRPTSTHLQGKARYFLGRAYQLEGYGPLAVAEYRLAALSPDSELLRKAAAQRLKELEP
ncbi:MAG: tetratricopeptide repeat protein, partial [Acidobacteriota bacterium]